MNDAQLSEEEIRDIDHMAESVAKHAASTKPSGLPTAEDLGISRIPLMMFPPPLQAMIEGMRHLMGIDPKIIRVHFIIESDNSPDVLSGESRPGEITISMVYGDSENPDEERHVNFGMDPGELLTMEGLYYCISVMEDRIRDIMEGKVNLDTKGGASGEG